MFLTGSLHSFVLVLDGDSVVGHTFFNQFFALTVNHCRIERGLGYYCSDWLALGLRESSVLTRLSIGLGCGGGRTNQVDNSGRGQVTLLETLVVFVGGGSVLSSFGGRLASRDCKGEVAGGA